LNTTLVYRAINYEPDEMEKIVSQTLAEAAESRICQRKSSTINNIMQGKSIFILHCLLIIVSQSLCTLANSHVSKVLHYWLSTSNIEW